MAGPSSGGREGKKTMFPKTEDDFDYEDLPPYSTFSANVGNNVASSSGGKLRAFFIGMGFLPSLVDKVIEENGEDNSDMLLEILLKSSAHKSNSDSSDSLEGALNTRRVRRSAPNIFPVGRAEVALQRSNSQSSDSLDSLFDDDDDEDPREISTVNQPKEEPDELSESIDNKRGSLLMMNFSKEEVEFAINRLGSEASVPELVDFIFAAQIAEKFKKEKETVNITRGDIFAAKIAQKFKIETDDVICLGEGTEISNEKLFGIMAKTLQLLEMGFSENEVSSAFDRLGPEVPISEYANFIFAQQNGIEYVMEYKYPGTYAYSMGIKVEPETDLYGTEVKVENFSHEPSQSRQFNLGETSSGNGMKKEECVDEFPVAASNMRYSDFMDNDRGKRPKYEYDDDSSFCLDPYWVEESFDTGVAGISDLYKSNKPRHLSSVAAKPPFFLFGNLSNLSSESWRKMSHFLYNVEPEFVNTRFFSALTRREGYLHNLPTENRFHIPQSSPMTIEDAIPQTKKWWPPWDSRKQLTFINSETGGIAQLCDRIGRMLAESGEMLSPEQQKDILRYCRGLNLVWTGKYKLSPIEPEQLEVILGYPPNHTRGADNNVTERLKSLKYCFQTDTLGYHLSVLKPLFPNGLTVLSLFSGIGGAEVALHRLGIKIKALISIETSETKRKIVERWWRSSGQKGGLVQMEDIQKLTTKTLDNLVNKFGAIDLVISQQPSSSSSSSSSSVVPAAGQSLSALDFSLFCEAVRILQRVRSVCY